jgi:N-acetylneuraminic acid mutarotase
MPGGRNSISSWIDTSGNLWLFGGDGYDSTGELGYLNDLWQYNPSTS